MKKQVLIGLAAFASLTTFAQNSYRTVTNPTAKKLVTFKPISSFETISANPTVANQVKKTMGAPYKRISGSPNILSVQSTETRAIQYNADINTVGFVYRKGYTYTGAVDATNGHIYYSYTSDNGTTWDSTVVVAPVGNKNHRYPAGVMYNPAANTNPANAYAVVSGPWHPGQDWQGVYFGSKQLSLPGTGTNGNVDYSDNLSLTSTQRKQDFARIDMQVTSNGNVYVMGDMIKDANDVSSTAAYGWRGGMINKGVFNAGTFTWTVDSLKPNFKLDAGNDPSGSINANMAWSEDGQTGYVIFYGVDANAVAGTSQNSFQPYVYKTVNAGGSWSRYSALFDFTSIPAVNDRLIAVRTSSTLAKPFISSGEGASATVDAAGNLHLFASLGSAYSEHIDSLGYTYSPNYNQIWNYLVDFKTTASGWDAMIVDSLSCSGPLAAESNWISSPNNIAYDARLQISRTTDGNHIIYSWADSDSTIVPSPHISLLPDIFMKGYDVVNNKMTCKKNMSENKPGFQYGSYFFYSSPRIAKPNSTTLLVPVSATRSDDGSNSGDISVSHYYMDDATFSTTEFTVTVNTPGCTLGTGASVKEENSTLSNLNFYPNPASTNGTIEVVLNENAKMDVVVINSVGQTVYSTSLVGNAGSNKVDVNLNNLSSGLYFYQVRIANSKAVTKKFVVNK